MNTIKGLRLILICSMLFTLGASAAGLPDAPEWPAAALRLQGRDPSEPPPVPLGLQAPQGPEGAAPLGEFNWAMLAATSYRDGNNEIYTMYLDGSNPVNRTSAPGYSDYYPSLNRGATKLAFTSTRSGNSEIYTVNLDGSDLRNLSNNKGKDYLPQWSPDGSKIVWVSERDGNPNIYMMNADGSGKFCVVCGGEADYYPAWSPDSNRIAWVKMVDPYYGRVYAVNSDGSGYQQSLTYNRLFPGQPAWSPDGKQIYYDAMDSRDYTYDIYRVWVSTLYDSEFYDPGGVTSTSAMDGYSGAVSPDGSVVYLTYAHWLSNDGGNNYYLNDSGIFTIQTESPYTTALVPGSGTDMYPSVAVSELQPPVTRVDALPEYTPVAGNYSVSWGGYDQGIAGLRDYHVQIMREGENIWQTITGDGQYGGSIFSPVTSFNRYPDPPGQRVYYRMQGRDRAMNVEAMPGYPYYDTYTTFYDSKYSGGVTDARGLPLPGVTISLTSPVLNSPLTGSNGQATLYTTSKSNYLQPVQSGFGRFDPLRYPYGGNDFAFHQYLPPKTGLLENGSFEGWLDGWETSGPYSTTRVISTPHSGGVALALGSYADGIQFEHLAQPVVPYVEQMAAGPDGSLHAMGLGPTYINNNFAYSVTHGILDPSGNWNQVQVLEVITNSNFIEQPMLFLDDSGGLHSVWNNRNLLAYAHRPAGGAWSVVERVGSGGQRAITVGPDGTVTIAYNVYNMYTYNTQMFFIQRSPAGTWSSPVALNSPVGNIRNLPAVYAAADGSVHFLWKEYQSNGSTGVMQRTRQPGGSLGATTILTTCASDYSPNYISGFADGSLVAVGMCGTTAFTAEKAPGENWVVDTFTDHSHNYLARDPQGGLHQVREYHTAENYTSVEHMFYRYRLPGEAWTEEMKLTQFTERNFAAWGAGRLAFVDDGGISTSIIPSGSQEPGIAQTVTIPAGINRPTLAFEYQLTGMQAQESAFNVYVDDGAAATAVFTATQQAEGWQHAWADLTPWAGETVTVTLAYHQAAVDPLSGVSVDDVSLGAWTTPVIAAVTPGEVGLAAGAVITITGENFLPGLSVKLGGVSAPGTQWVDGGTLRVPLPQGLPTGVLDVWVTNPGGAPAVLPGGLRVGWWVYLPAAMR